MVSSLWSLVYGRRRVGTEGRVTRVGGHEGLAVDGGFVVRDLRFVSIHEATIPYYTKIYINKPCVCYEL